MPVRKTRLLTEFNTAGAWIYFVACEREQMIKIGCARNPKQRFFSMKGTSPLPLEFLGAIPGNQVEERLLHSQWAVHHVRNEWFRAAPEIIEFVKLHGKPLWEAAAVFDE
jgi:hypothetical protein